MQFSWAFVFIHIYRNTFISWGSPSEFSRGVRESDFFAMALRVKPAGIGRSSRHRPARPVDPDITAAGVNGRETVFEIRSPEEDRLYGDLAMVVNISVPTIFDDY